MEMIDYKSCNNCHGNKTDDVSACRAGKLSWATGEALKYRDSDKSDKQVNQVAYSSAFPSEQI